MKIWNLLLFLLFFSLPSLAQDSPQPTKNHVLKIEEEVNKLTQKVDRMDQELNNLKKLIQLNTDTIHEIEIGVNETKNLQEENQQLSKQSDELNKSFKTLQENINELSVDVNTLSHLFPEGIFTGHISSINNDPRLSPDKNYEIEVAPRGMMAIRNHQSQSDLFINLNFYIRNNLYFESILKNVPSQNPSSKIQIHIPAHLLNKTGTPIPLLDAPVNYQTATTNLELSFEGFPGNLEKAELLIRELTETKISGTLDYVLQHKELKNRLKMSFKFDSPLDLNPFVPGNQN